MNRRLGRVLLAFAMALGLIGFSPMASPAMACPMCKVANEADDPQPRAYMYSILFMLSMPPLILAGFGGAVFLTIRKAHRLQAEQQIGILQGEGA